MLRRICATVGLVAAASLAAAAAAHAEVVWLCKPGTVDDPCEIPLDTTVEQPDGGSEVVTPERLPPGRRPIDCFYVYPTVSNQPATSADKSRDPELVSIAKYQAARFSEHCRMFAPVYRQVTLLGLTAGTATGRSSAGARKLAYSDVAEAWKEYLDTHNRGRGVVLIGHSQGTRMLRALIRREIDPRPALRQRLVGAVLLGGNVTVAEGEIRGGDFRRVPLCTEHGQFGCVVAYSTFSSDPPADSRYGGATEPDEALGLPGGAGYEVACTDPSPLSGMTGPFGITVPSEPFAPGPIALLIVATVGGLPPSAPTTWVQPADRYEGGCRAVNGANVLRYDPVGGSRRPSHAPADDWGTHLIDVNLAYERLTTIVGLQARRWLAARNRCAGGRLRVRVRPRRLERYERTRLRVRVTLGGEGVRGARVRIAGRTARTDRRGRARIALTPARAGTYRVTATRRGSCPGRASLRVRRAAWRSRSKRG